MSINVLDWEDIPNDDVTPDHGVTITDGDTGPWYADMYKANKHGDVTAFYQIRAWKNVTAIDGKTGIIYDWDTDRPIMQIHHCRDTMYYVNKGYQVPEPMTGNWWENIKTAMRFVADYQPDKTPPTIRKTLKEFHRKVLERLKRGYDYRVLNLHPHYWNQVRDQLEHQGVSLEGISNGEENSRQ